MKRKLNILGLLLNSIVLTWLLLFVGESRQQSTVSERSFQKIGNSTYCVYNKYKDTNTIYECVDRIAHPQSDPACTYNSDLINYMC